MTVELLSPEGAKASRIADCCRPFGAMECWGFVFLGLTPQALCCRPFGATESWRSIILGLAPALRRLIGWTACKPMFHAPKGQRHVAWGWRFLPAPGNTRPHIPHSPARGGGSSSFEASCRRPFEASGYF